MMHLVTRWAKSRPAPQPRIIVATVDHALRQESAREAEWIARQAAALNLAHETLRWEGDKPATGIQAAARRARYDLLAAMAWRCAAPGDVAIVTAHTEDDQAETFLMRLARGSGLDGLTGIGASRLVARESRAKLLRPLLTVPGARLRATLVAGGLDWLEDPSNARPEFERVRLRQARAALAALGLTNHQIALSARRLERARSALELRVEELLVRARLDLHAGAYASLDRDSFLAAAPELRLRILSRLIAAFGGQAVPVRLAKLEHLLEQLSRTGFKGATLGGCAVVRHADALWVYREAGRFRPPELFLEPGAFEIWDRRFRVGVAAKLSAIVSVRPLGGAAFARLRRELPPDTQLPPARAAVTLPAFWHQEKLICVPALNWTDAAWGRKSGLCSAEFLW
jgi:tRNA(Ile)-lysidine synthase